MSSRILRDQIKFTHRFDFLRITEESVLVPVTIQIPNREMHFASRAGVHSATLNLFGRVTTPTGRVVQTFEDVIQRDIPESLFRRELEGQSVYQKAVPLRPGLYRLNVVIKDVNSGDVGAIGERLAVPRFEENRLALSTLILADRIEPVPAGSLGLGPFVLGASKVRPRVDQAFTTDDNLGIYLQVYNLKLDEATRQASASIHCRIRRDDEEVLNHTATSASLGQRGAQLTIEQQLSLLSFAPGSYTVEIQVTDNLMGRTLTTNRTSFSVRPAAKVKAGN